MLHSVDIVIDENITIDTWVWT